MADLIEHARALPFKSPPAWVLEITDPLKVEVRLINWGDFLGYEEAKFAVTKGDAQGAPGPAFFHGGTLYASNSIQEHDLAHEVGHIVSWVKHGRPEGFNYGLDPDKGNDMEEEACWIEVYLMDRHGMGSDEDRIRDHHDIGIIISYNPDDDFDEDDDEYDGEAQYAWEEWKVAIWAGKMLVQEVVG